MNKKLFLGMFAATGMLLATSCSNDELDMVLSANEAQVTFNLSTEGAIATRAIGDGKTANQLVYAVFNSEGEPLSVFDEDQNGVYEHQKIETIGDITKTSHTVTISLTKDQTYYVAFWAQNSECKAYDTEDLRNVKVNYDGLNNDETRDAFFKTEILDVKGNESRNVELKRPFAQINMGVTTEDWEAAVASGIKIEKSAVVIKNVASKIDLLTGQVSGNETVVTYASNIIPNETLYVETDATKNGKEEYAWLSMSYILVPDESADGASKATLQSLQFTFSPENGNDIEFKEGLNTVPVQRNWRTNIIGSILTDDIRFNITIDNDFDDDYNSLYYVGTGADLAKAFAAGGGTITLTDNIIVEEELKVNIGDYVCLDMNGKTITVNSDFSGVGVFYTLPGSTLTITGDGVVKMENTSGRLLAPFGDVVIENGTFIRNLPDGTSAVEVYSFFEGTKVDPWGSQTVTINGGYFDGGYYDANASDIDDILAGTKTFVETEDDVKTRGTNKDTNPVRVAVKNNIWKFLNHSSNQLKVYGGTFVGANPAWGDEGCMLPIAPDYLRPWSYYQGALLDGQTFHEDGLVLPEGYTITKGETEKGVPTYTVTYNK